MQKKIRLSEHFDFLKELNSDAVLEIFPSSSFGDKKDKTTVLICPGGGYCNLSEWEAKPIADYFTEKGYNAFVLWYSLAPKRYPIQLCEVAASMEIIYKNAKDFEVDTNRIAVCGFSAGGHLAANYSVAYDCDDVRRYLPESKPVNATVLGYSVITATLPYGHTGSFENLVGKTDFSAEETVKYSCELSVTENTPPAFVWHTADDTVVSPMNSIMYASALMAKNIPVELHIFPFGNHGLGTAKNIADLKASLVGEWTDLCDKWLKSTL